MQTAGFVLLLIILLLAGESAREHGAWIATGVLWGTAGVLGVVGILAARFDTETLFRD